MNEGEDTLFVSEDLPVAVLLVPSSASTRLKDTASRTASSTVTSPKDAEDIDVAGLSDWSDEGRKLY